VTNADGSVVRTLEGPAESGLNQALWPMNDAKREPVPEGTYRITVTVGSESMSRPGLIREDGRKD
jgi:hypothetical protein